MNITYIFGNGFDLQLGLASSYKDFLKEYIKPQTSDTENIKAFKEYLSRDMNLELWSDAEKAMGEYLGEFSNDTVNDFRERIADFESRMVEYLEREQAKCSFHEDDKINQTFRDFIRLSFKDIMNRRGDEIGVDIDRSPNKYNFITFNYTNLLDRILDCCGGRDSPLRSRIVGGTRLTDQLGNIFHVHGALNSQIIMGVNDESQLNLKGGIVLTDRLRRLTIKPALNIACRHNWDVRAQNLISASDVILIYGVSYGRTDAVWWEKIQEWLRDDKQHKLVAFIRDSDPQYNKRLPWQEIDYEEDKREEFLMKLGVEPNSGIFTEFMEQTYIIANTTRLNLKGVLQKEPAADSEAAAALAETEETLQEV